MSPKQVLRDIWAVSGQDPEALQRVTLGGADPVFPSSFAVGCAAQTSLAAAALAACELGVQRGAAAQRVHVDMQRAALESLGWFSIDGRVPSAWDSFSGLYRCTDGWVRLHTNFAHHRDGALRLLGLDPQSADRAQAEAAMSGWSAFEYEEASARAGLVATALRSFAQWDASEQGQAVAAQPLLSIERLAEAKPQTLPRLPTGARPLEGLRVLELTRILAGPVAGRTLAAYGAEVMLVNSPNLPNIEAIADTSRGKLSTHIDLQTSTGRQQLGDLIEQAHVFIEGYRPGGIAALGFGPRELAARRPGLVYVSLSAYGRQGPWAGRRGFDSLLQAAMGFNLAEAEAAQQARPRPLPLPVLDQASGFLMAMSACAALRRQQVDGGSWLVSVSLAQSARWLRQLGRVQGGFAVTPPSPQEHAQSGPSGFGFLSWLPHAAELSLSPARWDRPSMPPGSHPPRWP